MKKLLPKNVKTAPVKYANCFHKRYVYLCEVKQIKPLPEILGKDKIKENFDIFGENLNVIDWQLIAESLQNDTSLRTIAIKLRKCDDAVLQNFDTLVKAQKFRRKPVIYTAYVYNALTKSITSCVSLNHKLQCLKLAALPLDEAFIDDFVKVLPANGSLKDLSFENSPIGDKNCATICHALKTMENVEKLNLSDCNLTKIGAAHVAELITFQRNNRYMLGWQRSLRYRLFDHEDVQGLRSITLAHNTQIGDDGLKLITECMKEDVWIKFLDMANCGLTQAAECAIMDLMRINTYIEEFNVCSNAHFSNLVCEATIKNKVDNNKEVVEEKLIKAKKLPILAELEEKVKILQWRLKFEIALSKKAENLQNKLRAQVAFYEEQLRNKNAKKISKDYCLVRVASLEAVIRERDEFRELIKSTDTTVNYITNSNSHTCVANKQIYAIESDLTSKLPKATDSLLLLRAKVDNTNDRNLIEQQKIPAKNTVKNTTKNRATTTKKVNKQLQHAKQVKNNKKTAKLPTVKRKIKTRNSSCKLERKRNNLPLQPKTLFECQTTDTEENSSFTDTLTLCPSIATKTKTKTTTTTTTIKAELYDGENKENFLCIATQENSSHTFDSDLNSNWAEFSSNESSDSEFTNECDSSQQPKIVDSDLLRKLVDKPKTIGKIKNVNKLEERNILWNCEMLKEDKSKARSF